MVIKHCGRFLVIQIHGLLLALTSACSLCVSRAPQTVAARLATSSAEPHMQTRESGPSLAVHERMCYKMTYGRTMKKAMATFDINPQNWYELAADREKWHAMIK